MWRHRAQALQFIIVIKTRLALAEEVTYCSVNSRHIYLSLLLFYALSNAIMFSLLLQLSTWFASTWPEATGLIKTSSKLHCLSHGSPCSTRPSHRTGTTRALPLRAGLSKVLGKWSVQRQCPRFRVSCNGAGKSLLLQTPLRERLSQDAPLWYGSFFLTFW